MTRYEHTGNERDLEAIDRVREAHVGAVNAGDAEAWAGLFADDGVQMPPHAPANVGRYDRTKLLANAELFVDWYLPRRFGRDVAENERRSFRDAWRVVLPLPQAQNGWEPLLHNLLQLRVP